MPSKSARKGRGSMYAVAWKHYTPSSRTMVKLIKVDKASQIAAIKAELAKLDIIVK